MRHLIQAVRNGLGDVASTRIDPRIQVVKDKAICLVTCQPNPDAVYLKWKGLETSPDGDFFVRNGPSTIKLNTENIQTYMKSRFNKT